LPPELDKRHPFLRYSNTDWIELHLTRNLPAKGKLVIL